MKKIVLLLLCALIALPTCAWAANDIEVQQEALYYQHYVIYCDVSGYWEVQNTGETPLFVYAATLDLFDTADESLLSDPMYAMYPSVLQPGETGYIVKNAYVDNVADVETIARHALTMNAQAAEREVTHLKVIKAEIRDSVLPGSPLERAFYVTVESEAEGVLYGSQVVVGAYDADGKLLFVNFAIPYETGLLTGSQVEICITLNPATVEMVGGLDKIAEIRAMAYME